MKNSQIVSIFLSHIFLSHIFLSHIFLSHVFLSHIFLSHVFCLTFFVSHFSVSHFSVRSSSLACWCYFSFSRRSFRNSPCTACSVINAWSGWAPAAINIAALSLIFFASPTVAIARVASFSCSLSPHSAATSSRLFNKRRRILESVRTSNSILFNL